ncbi:hypothetical protein [Streptomyces sp. NPDC047061]|uniref:hypothetical protein n=1 Tax=Streptomyces sp. NPDC047061 TaxID=3154605 RepID=UPI0033D646C3
MVDDWVAGSLTRELREIEQRIETLTRNRDAIRTYLSQSVQSEDLPGQAAAA